MVGGSGGGLPDPSLRGLVPPFGVGGEIILRRGAEGAESLKEPLRGWRGAGFQPRNTRKPLRGTRKIWWGAFAPDKRGGRDSAPYQPHNSTFLHG